MELEGKAEFEPGKGCMVWLGSKTDTGYPRARVKGKVRRAHREVYFDAHPDADPKGMVLHTCETAACVNLEHLRYAPPGTAAPRGPINMPKGENNCNGKLTNSNVECILLSRESDKAEAKRYGVSVKYLQDLRRGRARPKVFAKLRREMDALRAKSVSIDVI